MRRVAMGVEGEHVRVQEQRRPEHLVAPELRSLNDVLLVALEVGLRSFASPRNE